MLLVALATRSTPVPARTSPRIEVVDVTLPPAAVPVAPSIVRPSAAPSGGSRPGAAASPGRASHSLPAGGEFEDPRGTIRFDDGGDGGSGGGHGTGSGIGFGD